MQAFLLDILYLTQFIQTPKGIWFSFATAINQWLTQKLSNIVQNHPSLYIIYLVGGGNAQNPEVFII